MYILTLTDLLSDFSELSDFLFDFMADFGTWLTTNLLGEMIIFIIVISFGLVIIKTLISYFGSD